MNKLKEIREKKGFSQMKLAMDSGISRQRIIEIESDPNANMTMNTVAKLAEALHVKTSDIFIPDVN